MSGIVKEEEAARFANIVIRMQRMVEKIRARASRDLGREVTHQEVAEELATFMEALHLFDLFPEVVERYVTKSGTGPN